MSELKCLEKKWARRYLRVAKEVASWSKDPSTKVGAVLVSPDNHILSTGYNGFPQGLADTKERLETREIKYKYVRHAERNALSRARVVAQSNDLVMFITHPPCSRCLVDMKAEGVGTIVFPECKDKEFVERWGLEEVLEVADELNIEVIQLAR